MTAVRVIKPMDIRVARERKDKVAPISQKETKAKQVRAPRVKKAPTIIDEAPRRTRKVPVYTPEALKAMKLPNGQLRNKATTCLITTAKGRFLCRGMLLNIVEMLKTAPGLSYAELAYFFDSTAGIINAYCIKGAKEGIIERVDNSTGISRVALVEGVEISDPIPYVGCSA